MKSCCFKLDKAKSVRVFRIELECRSAGFLRRGESRSTRSRERTNNKLSPHMVRAQNRTRAKSVGSECSNHCASPAPHVVETSVTANILTQESIHPDDQIPKNKRSSAIENYRSIS